MWRCLEQQFNIHRDNGEHHLGFNESCELYNLVKDELQNFEVEDFFKTTLWFIQDGTSANLHSNTDRQEASDMEHTLWRWENVKY